MDNPTHDSVFSGDYKEVRLRMRRVVCAACRITRGVILAGPRHWDTTMHLQAKKMRLSRDDLGYAEQGFIDQFGVFMTRQEAWTLAWAKGQIVNEPNIPGTLFSEDLY